MVGIALHALKAAIPLPRSGQGLFDQYAKRRGNDSADAAVNYRLEKWKLTSHSFRHAMKDRLGEVGCRKDIRDAIQGHASGDIAETYGEGHTLRTMRDWLKKIVVNFSLPLSDYLLHRPVTADRYGRTVALVTCGGIEVNRGMAWVYRTLTRNPL